MNLDIKYTLPINNKEEWFKVNRDESFDAFCGNSKIEFFQASTFRIHYYNREPECYEGIMINFNQKHYDNQNDYIRNH